MQSQPDGEYNFILDYQDHLIKFCILRPLKCKTKEAVAEELTSIFSIMDVPHILQSDNGREFANQLVEEITKLWPECKMVHGKPRHSQSQGSVERNNLDGKKPKCRLRSLNLPNQIIEQITSEDDLLEVLNVKTTELNSFRTA